MKKNEASKAVGTYSKKRKLLSALAWIVLWPLVVGFIAFILLVGVAILYAQSSLGSLGILETQIVLAAFTGLVVLVCYGLIRIKKTDDYPLAYISINVLRTYIWLGIAFSTMILISVSYTNTEIANDEGIHTQQTNTFIRPELKSEQAILDSLARVGAKDIDLVETAFVANYNDPFMPDKAGEYQAYLDASGYWLYGSLTARPDLQVDELDSVVAHEYLHHVWFKSITPETKEKLTSDLIVMYGNDPFMHERVMPYANAQTLQPTELFSFYCTEARDELLTKYVLDECNSHINRASLVYIW